MYLRHSTITKNGKTHTYWRLVRSVRVGRKVRQETVVQLGDLDAQGRIAARHLADSLVGLERQPGLFDDDPPTEPVTIDPSRLRLERGRRFGDVWLAWKLWQTLELDRWLEQHLPQGREDVSWGVIAAVLVIARLCEPASELHIADEAMLLILGNDGLDVGKLPDLVTQRLQVSATQSPSTATTFAGDAGHHGPAVLDGDQCPLGFRVSGLSTATSLRFGLGRRGFSVRVSGRGRRGRVGRAFVEAGGENGDLGFELGGAGGEPGDLPGLPLDQGENRRRNRGDVFSGNKRRCFHAARKITRSRDSDPARLVNDYV
jgi:hypothetical protein